MSIIFKEYQITAATAAASSAQLLSTSSGGRPQRVILEAKTADVVFKFGDSTVSASKTVTSNALADYNFTVTAGAVFEVDIPDGNLNRYVSVQGLSADGTAIIRLAS